MNLFEFHWNFWKKYHSRNDSLSSAIVVATFYIHWSDIFLSQIKFPQSLVGSTSPLNYPVPWVSLSKAIFQGFSFFTGIFSNVSQGKWLFLGFSTFVYVCDTNFLYMLIMLLKKKKKKLTIELYMIIWSNTFIVFLTFSLYIYIYIYIYINVYYIFYI